MSRKILIAIVLALPAFALQAMERSAHTAKKDVQGKGIWIVTLQDVPLAVHQSQSDKSALPSANGRTKRLALDSKHSRDYLHFLQSRHQAVLARASLKAKRALKPHFSYFYTSNGFAIELTEAEAQLMQSTAGVSRVQADEMRQLLTDAGPQWIGADQVWNGAVAPSGIGSRGEGMVVGVIDTGIQADHPSFADIGGDNYDHSNPRGKHYGLCATGSAPCNDKLIGIYDFTEEAPQDGLDKIGHGTHVASTAAGNAVTAEMLPGAGMPISGVAPHANIIAYKACMMEGCPLSALVAAIDQAVADQVDVINYSIGGGPVDPWASHRNGASGDELSFLIAREAGVVPIVAAGNAGPGESTVGNPANAPWVVAIAATTHPRKFANALIDVNATDGQSGLSFIGSGVTAGTAQSRIVHAKDYGHPLCGTGEPEMAGPPTGVSNPFPPNTFHGEIVVCARGIYARVEKGYNLLQAGAAGMILVNAASDGERIGADRHFLPSVHLGYQAGQRLQRLLEQSAREGAETHGRISGLQREFVRQEGDLLATFSSRGPVAPFGGWLKPNIAAPGVNILAGVNAARGFDTYSGTSMATPHVAGAAALLKALKPNWSVSQIESALSTTASNAVRSTIGGPLLNPHQRGAGRIDLVRASQAELHFDVSRQDFLAADPVSTGDQSAPTRLNMPYLVHHRCFEKCDLGRSVTANIAGSWRTEIRIDRPAGASVAPRRFKLAAGASQALAVHVNVDDGALIGSWVHGELHLINDASGARQTLPIAIYADRGAMPETIDVQADATGGYRDIALPGLPRFNDAIFYASGLGRVESATRDAPQDPDRNEFLDPSNGGIVLLAPIPADAREDEIVFYAEAKAPSAKQISLLIGLDNNDDGIPDRSERICDTVAQEYHRCKINMRLGGSPARAIWVYAQNMKAGETGSDAITVQWSFLSPVRDQQLSRGDVPALTVTGAAGNRPQVPYGIRLSWFEPRLLPNETWMAIISMGGARTVPGQMGEILVRLNTSEVVAQAPVILSAARDRVRLRLKPGAAYERIVVDVPVTAAKLEARIQSPSGANVDLYAAKADALPSIPDFPPAPARNLAQASALHAAGDERIELSRPQLTQGRWYLTPVNSGSDVVEFELSVQTTGTGQMPALKENGYFNPTRSGHGLFFGKAQSGRQWTVAWYTYLDDQTPAWYLAAGPSPEEAAQSWHAPLYRYTWDGAASLGSVVGRAMMTQAGPDAFVWSWVLNGKAGSERMIGLEKSNCPMIGDMPADYSGDWHDPALPGYGVSVFANATTEAHVAYLYDGQGMPRWLYAQHSSLAQEPLLLYQYRGFCPYCAKTAEATGTAAGTLSRTFNSVNGGDIQINVAFQAPLIGNWNSSATVTKLTADLPCQ